MALAAQAPAERLAALLDATGPAPETVWLRAPETGTVMVRGRAGGTGAPFNLGEMTVTRCALTLPGASVEGHATVPGRDRDHARRAALLDALMQTDEAARIDAAVLAPLEAEAAARARNRAAKAEATKVDFYTMVRGEDT